VGPYIPGSVEVSDGIHGIAVSLQLPDDTGGARNTLGIKTGRIHHTLSNLEYGYLLLLEFSDEVVDIREQFPIFPTSAAKRIAAKLGIRYPVSLV
jgi:hypothetical protein